MSVQLDGANGDLIVGTAPGGPTVGRSFESFTALDAIFPTGVVGGPTAITRADSLLISFNDALNRDILFPGAMDVKYNGATLTVAVYWVAETAIIGDVVIDAGFKRLNATENIDTAAFAALLTTTVAAPGVNGDIVRTTFAFTQVQADGIVAGDPYQLLISRRGQVITDTMLGNWQLLRVTVSEP